MFVYSPRDSCCDSDEGVGLPSIVLYGGNYWVIFGVFMCEGLIGEYVVTIFELVMSWTICVGEGDIGVCVWFRAPMIN